MLLLIRAIWPNQIAAIGITNQRETTVVWDKDTGGANLSCNRLAVTADNRIS